MTNSERDRQFPASGDVDGAAFACTPLQERFWIQQHARGPQGLNVAMRWQVNGTLSHTAAEGALQALVRRHEVLRTSFQEVDGKLAQIVWPASAVKLNEIDLTVLPPGEREKHAEEIARAEALEPIDLEKPPLLRAVLLRLAADRSVLLLTLHSMIADGWSTGLIVREFSAAAHEIEAGRLPDLTEPELQFVDYTLWEKELLSSSDLDEARAFWKRKLQGVVGTVVPPDHQVTPDAEAPSHLASLLLPTELGQAVEGGARGHNVTLFNLAAAALALMLHRVTGEAEIVFGSQVANREEPAAADLIGPTVNSVTFRLPVDDRSTLHAFVAAAAESIQEALRHERLPFEIAETFSAARDGKPLHSVNLVLHRSYSGTTETEGGSAGRFSLISLPSYSSGPQWPLNFFMIGRDEGWRLSCEADASLYDQATATALLGIWRTCLEALATAPDGPIADCASVRALALPRTSPPPLARQAVVPGGPIPMREPERQIVRFHENGSLTPIVVLNNRSIYYQLARHLGEDRPLTDILMYHQGQQPNLGDRTFEDFGDYAVRLIRHVQPHGPYILGGHCVYGVLAFEAARQLRRMGEKVSLVALFDSWAPGYREDMSRFDRALRNQQLRLHHYKDRLAQFRRGEVSLNDIVRKPLLYRLGMLPKEDGPERPELPGEWFDSYIYDSVTRFRPAPYEGDVVLFRTKDPLRGRLFDERMGWGPLVTGRLTKIDIDSGHFDMFRERPAAEIAAFLRTQ